MYGKNTLDKIYLTQKKLLPHPSTSQRGKTLIPRQSSTPQRGNSSSFQGQIVIPSEAKRRIVIPSETKGRIAIRPYYSLTPAPRSLFPFPCSLLPVHWPLLSVHCSLLSVHWPLLTSLTPAHFTALYFMLKISCNTKKIVPLHQITSMGVDWFWQQA